MQEFTVRLHARVFLKLQVLPYSVLCTLYHEVNRPLA